CHCVDRRAQGEGYLQLHGCAGQVQGGTGRSRGGQPRWREGGVEGEGGGGAVGTGEGVRLLRSAGRTVGKFARSPRGDFDGSGGVDGSEIPDLITSLLMPF